MVKFPGDSFGTCRAIKPGAHFVGPAKPGKIGDTMASQEIRALFLLWASFDELRGRHWNASQYKELRPCPLFVKYVSDKAASEKNYLLDGPRAAASPIWFLSRRQEIGDKMNKIIFETGEETISRA